MPVSSFDEALIEREVLGSEEIVNRVDTIR